MALKGCKMNDKFTFFASYYDSIERLSPEIRGEFLDVLMRYALRNELPSDELNPVVFALFTMAKPNIDKSRARQEAGTLGGKQPSKTEANVKQNSSKNNFALPTCVSDKDKEKEKDKELESKKTYEQKPPRFLPPSLQEIQEHIAEKKMNVNGETFYFFYEAKGWKIGRDSMKSWTAALAQWNSRESHNSKTNEEQEWR